MPMHMPTSRSLLTALLSALLLSLAATAGHAADTPAPPPTTAAKPDVLAAARAAVTASQWQTASDELRRVNAGDNADWNNLMGYVSRKQAKPDLDASQRYYDAALRIDPKHMGALEYSGELALMKRDLPTAEARLATLAQLCSSPCEPLDDLRKAVAAYKSKK